MRVICCTAGLKREARKSLRQILEGKAEKVEGRIQPVLGQLEQTVPSQAKGLVKQARTAAEQLQGQVLNRTNGKSTGTKKTKAA